MHAKQAVWNWQGGDLAQVWQLFYYCYDRVECLCLYVYCVCVCAVFLFWFAIRSMSIGERLACACSNQLVPLPYIFMRHAHNQFYVYLFIVTKFLHWFLIRVLVFSAGESVEYPWCRERRHWKSSHVPQHQHRYRRGRLVESEGIDQSWFEFEYFEMYQSEHSEFGRFDGFIGEC